MTAPPRLAVVAASVTPPLSSASALLMLPACSASCPKVSPSAVVEQDMGARGGEGCSGQSGVCVLVKAHMRYAPSLRSFVSVVLEIRTEMGGMCASRGKREGPS